MAKSFKALASGLALAVLLSSCSASTLTDENIISIGAISSITGPFPFGEVPAAAEAVFERVNAEGGINGKTIKFISADDAGDPAVAAQSARRLVEEEGVVAFAGSASMVDCTANATYYEKTGVLSLTATGVEGICFETPNIVPMNNGSIQNYLSMLQFASDTLAADKVCAVVLTVPGLTEEYLKAFETWEEAAQKQLALVDTSVVHGDDPTPAILAAKKAECEAVVFNSNEPVAAGFMNAVKNQGMLGEAKWLTISAAYSEDALKVLNQQNTPGLYVGSEFLPFTEDTQELSQWKETMSGAGAAETSLAIGGYVAAEYLVEALRSITGEITKETVTEAIKNLEGTQNQLVGMPFSFETGDKHNPNRASKIVQATAGGWEVVSDWVVANN